ncbi:MAG: hypothetical protein ACXWVR_03035 [Rhodoplanes sp.]
MVEFKNRRDVERWLADKPSEVAVVIAARAALRALPALVVVESEGARLLPVLRAAAVATLAAVDPGEGSPWPTREDLADGSG